jgi:XTP/dITP diphosphohydrolase
MNESVLLVATRSSHKLREILSLLPPLPSIRIVDLESASVPLNPQEDTIERFETFEANALAKARYFVDLVGLPVLADDSGLCVDALDGAPGVRSDTFLGLCGTWLSPVEHSLWERGVASSNLAVPTALGASSSVG